MQDTTPLPWGALDRFQAHYIVRKQVANDYDVAVKTVLETSGHFGAKKITGISWNGGKLAEMLNADVKLNEKIAKQSISDASIFIEPTQKGIRIHSKWKNHLEFGVSGEMFEIYDKIAGHIKKL